MPIAKRLRKFYGRVWYTVTRPAILRRAGGRFTREGRYLGGALCERCGRPDRKQIYTYSDHILEVRLSPASGQELAQIRRRVFWLKTEDGLWHDQEGNPVPTLRIKGLPRKIKVVIQIGHLNHTPGDDRPDNLRAFCGYCHLNHDAEKHKETRCIRKDAQRPMFAEIEEAECAS